jgi:uncharacterized protein YkwD
VVLMACASVVVAQTPAQTPAQSQAREQTPGPDSALFARQLLAAINAERARLALSTLVPSPNLAVIALAHSRDMAAKGRLSHAGFSDRFQRADRDSCVENLASGPLPPDDLVQAWSASPAHRRNLVEPRSRQAGVASIDGYVTFFACE